MFVVVALLGCGSGIHGAFIDPFATDTGGNVSGNWQFTFTPAAGSAVLTAASGSIDQSGGTTSQGQFTTAVLLLSGSCFNVGKQLPTQGFAAATELSLNSFGDVGQYLNLTLKIANGGGAMSGTYAVQNGCAAGAHGSLTGTRYLPLTGTYAGSLGGAQTATLQMQQNTEQAGDGGFLLAGAGVFSGFGCFAHGTTSSPVGGAVSGSSATAQFITDEPAGSTLDIMGTFDAAAKTLTVSSYAVHGGGCNGQTGSGTLNVQ